MRGRELIPSVWPWLLAVLLLGCQHGQEGQKPALKPIPSAVTEKPIIHTRLPFAHRVISFGDLHGDYEATVRALKLAGLVDGKTNWAGGETVVVQTGDILDRGDGEREILDLFEKLTLEAAEVGGAFHYLLGNHELMNVEGNFKYATPGGIQGFRYDFRSDVPLQKLQSIPGLQRGRAAAFMPCGTMARHFEKRNVITVVGRSVFVHAGVLPEHARYGVERINTETRTFVSGQVDALPTIMAARNAPVWTRDYSGEETPGEEACARLTEALALLDADRMVVGHTVQEQGINSACDGKVWRTDVGMSSHYGGPVQVLEIKDGVPSVLKEATNDQ